MLNYFKKNKLLKYNYNIRKIFKKLTVVCIKKLKKINLNV